MSQENLDLVRAMFAAFTSRDPSSMIDHLHPDLEWRPAITPGGIEGNVYRGHDGARRWLREVSESWEAIEVIDLRVRAVGEQVLALGRMLGRGRASGVPIDRDLAQLWEFKDGLGYRAVGYMSHAEALEAAGLKE